MSGFYQYQFKVTINCVAPIISQSVGASAHGLDAAPLVDRDNIPVLPGTLIAGNLRHCWNYFASRSTTAIQAEQIDDWLGQKATDGTPRRGRLIFSEFWRAASNRDSDILHHRIAIEPDSGRVKSGALQVISSPFAPGREVAFSGTITAWLRNTKEADMVQKWLAKGLNSISSMGAFKGVGFGRILGVKPIQYTAVPCSTQRASVSSRSGIGLVIKPDRPVCFSGHLKGNNSTSIEEDANDKSGLDNQFISLNYIPGSAIKGAITTLLRGGGKRYNLAEPLSNSDYRLLCKYVDQICITHAQPAKNSVKRPLPLPLTTVTGPDSQDGSRFYDIALSGGAGLIYGQAPTFSVDWKERVWKSADAGLSLPARPGRSVSIHTAIKASSGASADHQLFSIEAVNPENHCWLANLILPELEPQEQQQLLNELQQFFAQGLHWLGKTGASAQVSIESYFDKPESSTKFLPGETLTITLVSHARLLKTGEVSLATNSGSTLYESYKNNWLELTDNSLRLIDFYAAQDFFGGDYWHKRYNRLRPYNPELFTRPGSVFVFVIDDPDKARKKIISWEKYGLPQLIDYSNHWQENPWIRENGYGEIAVNLEQHHRLRPKPGGTENRIKKRQWVAVGEVK